MLFGDLWVLKVSFMTHWHGILYTLSVICNDHLLMVLVWCASPSYQNDWLTTLAVPGEAARESLVWQITKGKSLFSLFSSSSTFSPDKNKIYVAETDKVRTSSTQLIFYTWNWSTPYSQSDTFITFTLNGGGHSILGHFLYFVFSSKWYFSEPLDTRVSLR